MSDDNVISFPKEGEVTVQDVLDKASEMELNKALLIGLDDEGILYLASSMNNPPDLLWMIKKVEKFILENF